MMPSLGRDERDARARAEARRQNDAGEESDTVTPTNPTDPNTPRTPDTGRPEPPQQPPDQSNLPNRNRRGTADVPAQDRDPSAGRPGATESETGDRRGPAVGYNQEPRREEDEGGVS
jgi:hypothetical protein